KGFVEFIHLIGFVLQIRTRDGYGRLWTSAARTGTFRLNRAGRRTKMTLHRPFLAPLHALVKNLAVLHVCLSQIAVPKSLSVVHFCGAIAITLDHLLDAPFDFTGR